MVNYRHPMVYVTSTRNGCTFRSGQNAVILDSFLSQINALFNWMLIFVLGENVVGQFFVFKRVVAISLMKGGDQKFSKNCGTIFFTLKTSIFFRVYIFIYLFIHLFIYCNF